MNIAEPRLQGMRPNFQINFPGRRSRRMPLRFARGNLFWSFRPSDVELTSRAIASRNRDVDRIRQNPDPILASDIQPKFGTVIPWFYDREIQCGSVAFM